MNEIQPRRVTKIAANPLLAQDKEKPRMMRVAAYCRVSTDDRDQINSYKAQIWQYAGAFQG